MPADAGPWYLILIQLVASVSVLATSSAFPLLQQHPHRSVFSSSRRQPACRFSNTNTSQMYFDFYKGHPNSVPTNEMIEIMSSFVKNDSRTEEEENELLQLLETSLQYLKDDHGQPELLQELAAFLARHTQDDDRGGASDYSSDSDVSENRLFLTNGASHGLDLLCATQTQPGDVVLVKCPTYFLALPIFLSHGLLVKALPMNKTKSTTTPAGDRDNSDGDYYYQVDVDALEQMLKNNEYNTDRIRMIYIIPTHQNPTGSCMNVPTRQQLAAVAAQYGIVVAADEVYHLLDWSVRINKQEGGDDDDDDEDDDYRAENKRRPARMALFNDYSQSSQQQQQPPPQCVSISTFTKIFAPGVRLGWIEAPPHIVDKLVSHGYIQSGGCVQPFVGALFCSALKRRIVDRVLSQLVASYRHKCRLLCNALETEPRIQFYRPRGGYFVCIQFPEGVESLAFLEFCKDKIRFMPGVKCDIVESQHGGGGGDDDNNMASSPLDVSRCARLCFAYLDDDALVDGAKCLIGCLHEFLDCKPQ